MWFTAFVPSLQQQFLSLSVCESFTLFKNHIDSLFPMSFHYTWHSLQEGLPNLDFFYYAPIEAHTNAYYDDFF